ncbi:Core-2/I-Branching enzyme [Opisthorchis viverrini]|uniref:Core-2/I-Branching enzyme n=1 Tax=Opisthorchis viverrini TaxID=6198 RepID=A0A1S8WP60_OPIVI|nr:Core-2/I-Branching enzyme [Opisthorchis viverrini]
MVFLRWINVPLCRGLFRRSIVAVSCSLVFLSGYLVLNGWDHYLTRIQTSVPSISGQQMHDCLQSLGLPTPAYNYTVTAEERSMPLAYSILVYTEPERMIRLLTAIYRPHNFYCIHVDRKSSLQVSNFLNILQKCYGPNVFIVPYELRSNVRWGYVSVLEPEITCAGLLIRRNGKWKYWINLTGQELPLRTNRELVWALKALNGTNLVGATFKRRNLWRIPTSTKLAVTWYKGPVHVVVRREFVEFMLNDNRASRLLEELKEYEASKGVGIHPDETYFATLNHNPQIFPIPGSFLGVHEYEHTDTFVRYKVWQDTGKPCGSERFVHSICMLGVRDLPRLFDSSHFFANKFIPDVDPMAYTAMESWLAMKVAFESSYGTTHPSFNVSVYAKHEVAWNHL